METPLAPEDESLINFLILGASRVRHNPTTQIAPVFNNTNLQLSEIILKTYQIKEIAEFYATAGFTVEENDENIDISYDNKVLIKFIKENSWRRSTRRGPGLFHIGVKFSCKRLLINRALNILLNSPQSFKGIVNNQVSTSLYFSDPDGNTIKFYVDNPKHTWVWKEDGSIQYSVSKLDITQFVQDEAENCDCEKCSIDLGLIHLQVSRLKPFQMIFDKFIKMSTTLSLPSIMFFGADGYHHNIAINTWNSRNSSPMSNDLLKGFKISINKDSFINLIDTIDKFDEETRTVFKIVDNSLIIIEQGIEIEIVSS